MPEDQEAPKETDRRGRDRMRTIAHQYREAGRLRSGGVEIEPTPPEELEDLRLSVAEDRRARANGEATTPVTIRLRRDQIERLRIAAAAAGVKGYQTYLKTLLDSWLEPRVSPPEGLPVIVFDSNEVIVEIKDSVGATHFARGHLRSPAPRKMMRHGPGP